MQKRNESMAEARDDVSPEEWQTRVDLAALCRLVAAHGWDDLLLSHMSARVPGEDAYLINPYGLLFEEIRASDLLKVDYQGQKLIESDDDVSPEANVIHGAIMTARNDINCVAHVHTIAGTAVSSKRSGLLNISQQSMVVAGSLAYHDFEGIVLDPDEGPRLAADLGDKRHMILRNHGLLAVGPTVSGAYQALYNLQRACEMQVAAESGGGELIPVSDEIMERTYRMFSASRRPGKGDPVWAAMLRRVRGWDASFES